MSGQDKAPKPPRNPARRPGDSDPHLLAGGPRHMRATSDPNPGPWTTRRLVTIAARLHERRLNQRLARYKLTISALDAMEAVAELQPATATDVAALLCVTRQSLGKVLRRLQSMRFMTKEPGRDGRSAYLKLTREGRDVLSAAGNLVQEGTGNESEDDHEFRHQLEQHIRQLRSTEQGRAAHESKEQRTRTGPVPRHGQEQRTNHSNYTGATTWLLQQTGQPEPKQPSKGQPRQ